MSLVKSATTAREIFGQTEMCRYNISDGTTQFGLHPQADAMSHNQCSRYNPYGNVMNKNLFECYAPALGLTNDVIKQYENECNVLDWFGWGSAEKGISCWGYWLTLQNRCRHTMIYLFLY